MCNKVKTLDDVISKWGQYAEHDINILQHITEDWLLHNLENEVIEQNALI